jgi:stage III sporulation protein SpoIIIAA
MCARRPQVVQNHTPQIVVVDEIGTPQEVRAVRTISQRGVVTVGTAHGTDLSSVLNNHELSDLVGGIATVTLGDAQVRQVGCAHMGGEG